MADHDSNKSHEEIKEDEETNIEKDEAPIDQEKQDKIVKQIEKEYILASKYSQAKRITNLRRLKLYNNQKRDQSAVGDPLLFTIMNTILAALYADRLVTKWGAREEGDGEVAENLNALSEYDYEMMEKDELDYYWDWDACFYGVGYIRFGEFDRKTMTPVAELIDPMMFVKDPSAISINGDQKGRGEARFFGREITNAKYKMEKHPSYFNIGKLLKSKEINDLIDEARQARREAQNLQQVKNTEDDLTENFEYHLLEWYTVVDGDKYMVTLGNGRKLIVRYQKINDKKVDNDLWPIIERRIFPISHDADGVSIPDLIEDKQRARSVMVNLGMKSAIADLYPSYIFDKNKIKNPRDLDWDENKFIPSDGDVRNAVAPVQKSVFHSQVNLILNILDLAAQKAVATPETSQGVQPRVGRTLGEIERVEAGSEQRHSLAAKIFGWSEKRFWRQWYALYKKHFHKDIDEKTIRLEGPLGPDWRTLTKENITANKIDPDVKIESTFVLEAARRKKFEQLMPFVQLIIQDPDTNRRYAFRRLGKVLGNSTLELKLLIPPNIDELRASDENKRINDNKLPKVNAADDDITHLEIHNKSSDTAAKLAHIEAHKNMMMVKKINPQLFPPPAPIPQFSPVGVQGQPSPGREEPVSVGQRGGGQSVGLREQGGNEDQNAKLR